MDNERNHLITCLTGHGTERALNAAMRLSSSVVNADTILREAYDDCVKESALIEHLIEGSLEDTE